MATLRRLYALLTAHDIDGFGELLSTEMVDHDEVPGAGPMRDRVMDFFRLEIAAFPDLAMTVEDIVDGGDKVVARVRLTGTHKGDFMGIPATGRQVDIQLIDIMRLGDDGLVHEHWGVFDEMTLMRQLGAVTD